VVAFKIKPIVDKMNMPELKDLATKVCGPNALSSSTNVHYQKQVRQSLAGRKSRVRGAGSKSKRVADPPFMSSSAAASSSSRAVLTMMVLQSLTTQRTLFGQTIPVDKHLLRAFGAYGLVQLTRELLAVFQRAHTLYYASKVNFDAVYLSFFRSYRYTSFFLSFVPGFLYFFCTGISFLFCTGISFFLSFLPVYFFHSFVRTGIFLSFFRSYRYFFLSFDRYFFLSFVLIGISFFLVFTKIEAGLSNEDAASKFEAMEEWASQLCCAAARPPPPPPPPSSPSRAHTMSNSSSSSRVASSSSSSSSSPMVDDLPLPCSSVMSPLFGSSEKSGGGPVWWGLLVQFGKARFPPYVTSALKPPFPSRAHYQIFELAIVLSSLSECIGSQSLMAARMQKELEEEGREGTTPTASSHHTDDASCSPFQRRRDMEVMHRMHSVQAACGNAIRQMCGGGGRGGGGGGSVEQHTASSRKMTRDEKAAILLGPQSADDGGQTHHHPPANAFTTRHPHRNHTACPDGVDPEVFEALPDYLRREIVDEAKRVPPPAARGGRALGLAASSTPSSWRALLNSVVETCLACLLLFAEWDNRHDVHEETHISNLYLNWWLNAGSVLASLLWRAVSFLEKTRDYETAIRVLQTLLQTRYSPRRRGRWWNRLVVNEGHLKVGPSQAWETICMALNDEEVVEGDRLALLHRQTRLRAKLKSKPVLQSCPIDIQWDRLARTVEAESVSCGSVIVPHYHIIGRALSKQAGVKSRYIGYDDSTVSVEDLVLQHYYREDDPGYVEGGDGGGTDGGHFSGLHCEGGTLRFLFALFMWECLFAPVADVFQTPYQDSPLDLTCDMDSGMFYNNRKSLIDTTLQRLTEMSRRELLEKLAVTYRKQKGTFCRGCQWKYYPLKHLQCAALCIGGVGLSAICRKLAMNYAYFAAGLPDLFLWRVRRRRRQQEDSQDSEVHPWEVLHICNVLAPEDLCREIEEAEGLDAVLPLDELSNAGPFEYKFESKFIEVKSKNDRLAPKQVLWLKILRSVSLDASVCHVLGSDTEADRFKSQLSKEEGGVEPNAELIVHTPLQESFIAAGENDCICINSDDDFEPFE
jgi:hypothetical protein